MEITTIKKTIKLHFKENELVACTIPNGVRKMYLLTEMNELQDDAFWETDKAQTTKEPL